MLLLDSPAQERWAVSGKQEKVRQQRADALAQEILSNTVSVNLEDGWDATKLAARMGQPLTTIEVGRRLKLCNPRLIIEKSIQYPDLTGIYLDADERSPAGTWTKRKVFLFTMASGAIMPEFEVAHTTVKKVPNPDVVNAGDKQVARDAVEWLEVPTVEDLTRGWRTVLIRLLKAKLINRGDVEKHFGWLPSHASEKWYTQTA